MNSTVAIRKYIPAEDYKNLLALISSEGEEWQDYLRRDYQQALEHSITYVAYKENALCGYVRSIDDGGYFTWVVDLLVSHRHRGGAIGEKLLRRLLADFPDQQVFVMSDVDDYYEKLGFEKKGSIYEVR